MPAPRTPLEVREGTFVGGLPYLAVGLGRPLVYLCGSTPNHRNAQPGLERWATLRAVEPLARAGFEVYYTNRWPGMRIDITFSEVADRHAEAILDHFGEPVDVLGHSTGGSLALQLVLDRPDAVRRCVAASAAYALGPLARRSQLSMLASVEGTGRFSGEAIAEGMEGMIRSAWVRSLLRPAVAWAARRITIENPDDAAAMLRAEDGFDVRDRLGEITTPTLVICGARDSYYTPEMFAETAFRMPGGRLKMYPDVGHNVPGAPRFAADVGTFLAE